MDFHRQKQRAVEEMQRVVKKQTGETCIDYHSGIAHKLPEDYDEDDYQTIVLQSFCRRQLAINQLIQIN